MKLLKSKDKYHILKNKNFLIYISGFLVSGIGSTLCNFSSSLFILHITDSAMWMSVYLSYTTILYLILTPIMGVICDRLEKKKILYICDFIFGISDLILGLMILYGINGKFLLISIFINSTINNIVLALYQPASQSIIPLILNDEELNKGYSYISTVSNFISILGTIFASVLYSLFGYSIILIINGCSFILSAIAEIFLDIREVFKENYESNLISDFKIGYSYMKKKKELIELVKYAVLANFFLSGIISIVLPYMINSDLQLKPIIIAIMQVSFSIGGILIAIKISNKENIKIKIVMQKGFFKIVIFVFIMYLNYILLKNNLNTNSIFIIIESIIILWFGIVITNMQIPINISYISHIEPEYYARVLAIRTMLSSISVPIASLVYGYCLDLYGVGTTFILSLIGMILCFIYVKRSKYIDLL